MNTFKQKLENAVSLLEQNAELCKELNLVRTSGRFDELADELNKEFKVFRSGGGMEVYEKNYALETIVLALGRPVLAVRDNSAVMEFTDVESEFWRIKLESASQVLLRANRSIGRVELKNHVSYSWVGTAWVVEDGILVTNRHVAEIFATNVDGKFMFRSGLEGKKMSSSIDFLKEFDNDRSSLMEVEEVLYIEPDGGPDLAFLKLKMMQGNSFPDKIVLSSLAYTKGMEVAVIGYPAKDSRISDQALMERIFGNVFDKKRLAPGTIIGWDEQDIFHDCSTLGGNSGSAVIDIRTGEALGIHFAGSFMDRNFAVRAEVISERLATVLSGNHKVGKLPVISGKEITAGPKDQPDSIQFSPGGMIKVNIPLTISIDLGEPVVVHSPVALVTDTGQFTEGVVSDYYGRVGYKENFLGEENLVPLPLIKDVELLNDMVRYDKDEYVLKYMHFSIAMSASRRLCAYSAVNIDAVEHIKVKRTGWRLDPRIPKQAQIIEECYGNSPKFSRGHMTRREDPIWGSIADAQLGNSDSMHVTNTVPQMQTLNGVVWLALEDYALQNARKDKMKISVFTGPVLLDGDPWRYGVQIPVSFWKIIVFIHDLTKKLCATGYLMSQETHLKNQEFVFGKHNEEQVPISRIEGLTGLSFGYLNDIDPLAKVHELPNMTLTSPNQIRFF